MRRLVRHRPSPAMVVACLALGIALTGTSVAAVTALAPNSVGTRADQGERRHGGEDQERERDRRQDRAERGHRSQGAEPLAHRGGLRRRRRCRRAPPGRPAPPGLPGPAGPAGTIGPITVRQAGVVVPGGVAQNGAYDTETVTVNCNAGEKAISAGTGWSDDAADRELWTQRITPIITNNAVTGFRGTGGNDSGNSSTFTLYVLCYTA